jgi:drug/metabolite transporter (DMT)-like permease
MKTPLSSMLLVFVASFIGSIAAVLLKAGANRLKEGWWASAGRLGAGIGLFVLSSVLYVWGLKDGSLTVLYPMVSLGYVWTLLWSRMFFGEPFNRPKVAGLALVLLGVFFIGAGNQ